MKLFKDSAYKKGKYFRIAQFPFQNSLAPPSSIRSVLDTMSFWWTTIKRHYSLVRFKEWCLWTTFTIPLSSKQTNRKKKNDRAVFNWVSKVISELHWFCITSLSDWFKVLAPLFQPIRSKTKTNRGSRVHIFPRFVSATCNYFEFWLVYWIVSVLFDWPK